MFAGTLASMADPPQSLEVLRCDVGEDRHHTDESAELGLDLIHKYLADPSMSPNQKIGAIHDLCCTFAKSRLKLCCTYEEIMFRPDGERRTVAPTALEFASERASSALARSLPKPPQPPPRTPTNVSSGCWVANAALARCKKSRPPWKEEPPEPPVKKARPVGRQEEWPERPDE